MGWVGGGSAEYDTTPPSPENKEDVHRAHSAPHGAIAANTRGECIKLAPIQPRYTDTGMAATNVGRVGGRGEMKGEHRQKPRGPKNARAHSCICVIYGKGCAGINSEPEQNKNESGKTQDGPTTNLVNNHLQQSSSRSMHERTGGRMRTHCIRTHLCQKLNL